jgi:hypothetical protein
MLSAVFGLFLVLFALAVILFIVSLLYAAVHLPLGRAIERRRFASRQERGRRGDRYLESGDVPRALEAFLGAFYLDTIVSDRDLLSAVHNHHTGLLSRLITVTEEVQGGTVRLMSLAKADKLLTERTDLHRRYFRARDGAGRAEHTRDLYRKLHENRRELRTCLRQLVSEITASRAAEQFH